MPPPTQKTFGVYELTERILLHLNNHLDIIRAQRSCWYQRNTTEDAHMQPVTAGGEVWKLNPAFNCIGVSVSKDTSTNADWVGQLQDKGDFSLGEHIYDEPGSWTTMLATRPPCQRMLVECYSDYSHDQTMTYLIVSMTRHLLMGDIMAVLAECQNRQQCGLERSGWDSDNWPALDRMPDDVSIKEFQWDPRYIYKPVCQPGYKANLLVVREYREEYLSFCSHIFRLIADVEQQST
ncbi:hypothetical protein BDW72DRAFT_214809 [Aspergillus terricola var. indicus]